MSKRPELLIKNGVLAGKRFPIKEGGLRLGRSSSNDIHIPDGELSRNHCLFETVGEDVVRLTDLASANGTVVNGKLLGNDPVELKLGDVIEVGSTVVEVVGDEPVAPAVSLSAVDLGFGEGGKPQAAKQLHKRSMVANLLWVLVVMLMGAAAYLLLFSDEPQSAAPKVESIDEDLSVCEAHYERVDADSAGIFRYEMTFSRDGVLRVSIDDVPKENRHMSKGKPLDAAAVGVLNEILAFRGLKDLDREYVGVEPDPPALKSWTLRVIYGSRVRVVKVVNTQEPEAFRIVREKLEAFSKNELGVWAMQYSRDKLVELAQEAVALGAAKYEDRDVNYGNLAASVAAYREAIFYLETVNPKPECHQQAQTGLASATAELNRRYADQRFVADRACNLGQWETAKRELGVLLEMIPDRHDDRNREATAKLLDVENRMQKGGK